MNSQKIENLLNLALDATPEEREKSFNLNVGYNSLNNEWNLIVKYVGNLEFLRSLGISAVELLSNYAIITAPENLIDQIARLNEIVYVEKPKRLNFSVLESKSASCITRVQDNVGGLFGSGCIVAIIDSGDCVIIMSSWQKLSKYMNCANLVLQKIPNEDYFGVVTDLLQSLKTIFAII